LGIEDSKDCNAESPSGAVALGPGWLGDLAAGIAARNDSKAESPSCALVLDRLAPRVDPVVGIAAFNGSKASPPGLALPVPSLLNPR
jgi:hypothetical protein